MVKYLDYEFPMLAIINKLIMEDEKAKKLKDPILK